jgi:hypothetical protein
MLGFRKIICPVQTDAPRYTEVSSTYAALDHVFLKKAACVLSQEPCYRRLPVR